MLMPARGRAIRASLRPVLALVLAGLAVACAPRETEAVATAAVDDAAHPGAEVYQQWCAACHDNAEASGAPSYQAIRQLNRATVRYALELGYMQQQAKNVPKEELEQLIDWLPAAEAENDAWVEAARCPIKLRRVKLDGAPRTAVSFGIDLNNTRAQSAEAAGLSKADMSDLELAWAVAFPQTPTMRAQPVVVGSTLFIAATDAARLYALDAGTGCVKWMYASDMTLRSSLAFAEPTDKHPALIVMGDAAGRIHAVDAVTGAKVWVTDIKLNALNRVTGAPVIHDGVVYAPLSAIEVNYAGDPNYECCKGQGAMVALDLATGEKLWVGRTMEEATPQLISKAGVQQWGPSGAIIWSTPLVDPKRGVVYAATGENTSWPATDTSDAIIAYDLKTGARRWVFQATKADIWNYACGRRGPNCDWPGEYHSPDHDFGAHPMLIKTASGRELLVAGQKSGVLWAIDPATGQQVWGNRIGRGSASGGIHWGTAFDGTRIFAPLNDRPGNQDNPNWGPGLHAVNAETGEIEWTYQPNERDCGAELPVAKARRPAPEQRMLAVTAPVLPPARTAPAQVAASAGLRRRRCGSRTAGRPARPAAACALPHRHVAGAAAGRRRGRHRHHRGHAAHLRRRDRRRALRIHDQPALSGDGQRRRRSWRRARLGALCRRKRHSFRPVGLRPLRPAARKRAARLPSGAERLIGVGEPARGWQCPGS
jgi:polyvinyl alcohol dehydrogenase (cytochrome)